MIEIVESVVMKETLARLPRLYMDSITTQLRPGMHLVYATSRASCCLFFQMACLEVPYQAFKIF